MKKLLVFVFVLLLSAISVNAAFDKTQSYDNNFSDVKEISWYYDNVKMAYELGFMNGKSEKSFDPDGNVTVAEALVMASRLHEAYFGTEITNTKQELAIEYRYDFNDASIIVDLTQRNSRNDNGVSFRRATGEIKDGALVVTSDGINANGNYDPQIEFEGLDLDTKVYNKMKFRMKREVLPNLNPDTPRNETVEIFFKTSSDPNITGSKCLRVNLLGVPDLTEWFEIEVNLSSHKDYVDYLRGFRFDPTNNNGVYYIDYIVLYSDENKINTRWYDAYVDYAVQNGIVHKDAFKESDMTRNITRRELCTLFASALPEEHYNPINNIKGIPDIDRDEKNADVFLMLYNAGVILGSDSFGNFKPDSEIKRCEVATIINRAALPENRARGTIGCDWTTEDGEFFYEFDDPSIKNELTWEAESFDIRDGAIYLKVKDRGEGKVPRYDPKISFKNVSFSANEFTKMRVRMKAEFLSEADSIKFDLYFMTDDDTNFSAQKSVHQDFFEYCYIDAAGWYVIEVDLRLCNLWKGNVTAFRFDPSNTDGRFVIDYIRFIKDEENKLFTHDELVSAGYSSERLFKDEQFERGFYVNQFEQKEMSTHGRLDTYCETDEDPLWQISPWWSGYDLIDDRNPNDDKYTISDNHGVNTIKYNPEEKSVIMRQNATNYYNGRPHYIEEHRWWPHLLVTQNNDISPIDKERTSAAADRMFVELDVRLLDFKDSTNKEGINNITFSPVFYLKTDKAPGDLVWFCICLFRNPSFKSAYSCTWAPDSAAHQYMYGIPEAVAFNGIENSFTPEKGTVLVSDEWKHVRIDITPHIERVVEWANRDNIFGVPITKEDLYFEGESIGFEIHGNYDCTFEFKNYNMIAYNKAN